MKNLLLILTLSLTGFLSAQETPTIQIRTLCFQRDSTGLDKLAVVKPDLSLIEVRFPESSPSEKIRVPLVEGKVVFRDPSKPNEGAVAIANIPSGLKNALIMFFPGVGGEDEPLYRTVVIDATLRGIPEDGALVMNIFPAEVRAVIGEHRVLLPSGKSAGLARPKQRNDYNMSPVVFQEKVENEWKTVAETLVRFPPEQQQFFVSFPDSRTKRLAFRSYQLSER